MKTLVMILALFAAAPSAFASDRLQDEVICDKVLRPGEADHGLTLVLRGNKYSWTKMVDIIENGIGGPRAVAGIAVPAKPVVISYSRGFIPEETLLYEGKGLRLEIRVLRIEGRPLSGLGHVKLSIPDFEEVDADLNCKAADQR